ncbi:uncharacterized protein [Salminus brasiliensis]|uniref:uncharacterized protein isoform X2 n=1 Tax=Salminus brasiliensis TaxID=930266 RepID=UPI003B82C974
MAKGRKKQNKKAPPQGHGPNFKMPPPSGGPADPGGFRGRPLRPGEFYGRPPHPMGPPGPRMPGERFPMGPHDFGPPRHPMMEGDPFMDDPRDFMMRGQFMRENDFHPREFEGGPRFHQPHFEGRPGGFHPADLEGGPPFPHPDFEDRLPDRPPPEFGRRPGPGPGPGPGFYPPPCDDMRGPGYPVMDPGCAPLDGYTAVGVHGGPGFGGRGRFSGPSPHFMGPGQGPLLSQDMPGPPPSTALGLPPAILSKTNQQASDQSKSENTKSTALKTAASSAKSASTFVKPPPGRSMGVISFIGNNYGFIEREDLKKFSFPFDAYFGNRDHLVPGVKVHFTAVRELGKECATDVKVAPGGTEEIDGTFYEGVVTTVLPDTYVTEPHPGRIRTILSTDPIKLPFGKVDTKATLLLFDRVKFQLLTDIITKITRATNIMPQIPETFQLTKETRETGVIMTIKKDVYTIMSKKHENITASVNENVCEDELSVTDEVEFTAMTTRDMVKAIRLKKLPEGSVVLNSQAKNKIAEAKEKISVPSTSKDKWKPVTSEAMNEEAGVNEDLSEKHEGTIIQVIPKNPNKGVVAKLYENSGLIKTPQDPLLFFDLSEVMEATKLTLLEKVEFTLMENKGTKEGKRAIRIRRLTGNVFTPVPKLEGLGEKEKKKMTIKLLTDPKDLIKNEVKTDVKTGDSVIAKKPEKGKLEASKAVKPTKEQKQDTKGKPEKDKLANERSRSRESSNRRRSSRSRSRSRDRSGSYYRRHRSSSHEKGHSRYRRSRSHSRDRTHRYRRSHSRSRSRERNSRSGKKRSHSPEHRDGRHSGRSNSKERSSRRRSRSPDKKTEGLRSSSKSAGSSSFAGVVEDELVKKKKELLELNELIARKRAIIAMEQNTKSFKDVLEMDRQHGFATFDYQHKTCVENTWVPDLKPAKSILKKHSDPLADQHQASKRSMSPGEPVGFPKSSTTSLYACPVPSWIKEGSLSEDEDQDLERKKRQLEELSESIARKRAIVAMEQKAKAISDGPEMKKEHSLVSCSDDFDLAAPVKNTWQLDIKPDLQPKKSILKKRSEPPADQQQSATSSTDPQCYSHSLFPICNPPQDDYSAFSKTPGSSHTEVEKSTNLPNTFGVFERLINKVSTTSRPSETSHFNNPPGQRSFSPVSDFGPFYSQKSTGEAKASSYENVGSTSHSQNHQSSFEAPDQPSSGDLPPAQPSTSDQKRNLATQMQRFLSALNKADSNLLSSLMREAKKDSMGNPKAPQLQSDKKVALKDELYDPFRETEDREDNPSLIEAENYLEDHGDDDLLPHERAVQDGSGFSRIVGMKYGSEAKAENRFFYEEKKALNSLSRFSEEHKPFLERDQYELHRDPYSRSAEGYQNLYSQVKDSGTHNRERYEGPRPSKRFTAESNISPVQQTSGNTSEDVAKKTEHFEKIQNLLQTIGLKLDTSEVSKLADRTRERLYGKVKPQSASSQSSDQKDKQSVGRNDRGGSRADSSDSEGVRSVSPTRSSNREVYMSYWDSVKCRDQQEDEVAGVKERNLLNLKMTIKNSSGARQVTPDPYKHSSSSYSSTTEVTCDSYKHTPSAQPVTSFYAQPATESSSATPYLEGGQSSWESSYHLDENQRRNSQDPVSPYGCVPPSPLPYTSGIHIPLPPVQSSYGTYTTPLFPVPPPIPPPVHIPIPPLFSTPIPFGPPPTPPYPPPASQFAISMQPGGSGYTTMQAKIKPTGQTRCLKTIETVKTNKLVSATPALSNMQPALISIQTVEKTQPTDTQREDESKQAASISEDDIKAKQKKRLEQFNQRMRLKKEQQMEAQRVRGQSQKSVPGKLTRKEVKNVWICGHSLVFWAEKRATSPEFGMQLGMDHNTVRIWWKGVQGMTWQQLLPQLLQLKDNWPRPDVILIHLGGNDLGKTPPEAFLAAVKKDLISMKSIFPECLLVWSNILPRRTWRHSDDRVGVDNTRKAINISVCSIIAELGGSSLAHENIKPGLDLGLYRPDGVHLSGKGIDTFNLNMQDFLEKWESEINEGEPSED